jgi:hypothetical protein
MSDFRYQSRSQDNAEHRRNIGKVCRGPLAHALVANDFVLLELAPAQMIQGTPRILTGAAAGQRRA